MVMFGEAFKEQTTGTFLTVQRFRFCTSTVGSMASILGGELRSFMPHSAAKKKKRIKYRYQNPRMQRVGTLGNNSLSWNEILEVLISGERIN